LPQFDEAVGFAAGKGFLVALADAGRLRSNGLIEHQWQQFGFRSPRLASILDGLRATPKL